MPEKFNDIADGLVKVADNKGRWQRIMGSVVILAILIIGGFVIYNKTKPVKNDCSKEKLELSKEKIELIDFFTNQIIDLKNKYEKTISANYSGLKSFVMFAVYDTTRKPMTPIDSLLKKLDSVRKQETRKQDSIKKSKT